MGAAVETTTRASATELERERRRMGRVAGILWTASGLVARANEVGAHALAETIRIALAADAGESGMPPPAASVGWAVFPEDGEDYGSLVRTADKRMLREKQTTRAVPGEPTVRLDWRG